LYDVGSRLTRVCSNAACNAQIRRFVYDNRGFLIQERHPEIGVSEVEGSGNTIIDPDGFVEEENADAGNDWTFYTYDARGNVLTKDVEGSTEFDLAYRYDPAGRLLAVEESNSGDPRPLKEFYYASSNVGADLRKGKLYQTKRHNWVEIVTPLEPNPGDLDAVITETFKYAGRDGRVSARQTRFTLSGTTYAFDLSQTYDDLGNVETLTYPQCLHSQGGCPDAAPPRTVSYEYTKGFLREIVGFADEISYQAGGMLHQIEHSNGVVYTMEINPEDGLERPYRISTTAGWDTGTYGYDGVGNIHRIGSQVFRYDRLNRLVSGQVEVDSALKTQNVSYDTLGNITSLTTDGSVQPTPTDPATNRLQSPLAQYDGAGNLTTLDFGSERYEYTYDGVNMMKYLRSDTDLARIFLYSADDERIAQFDCATGVCQTQDSLETWTIRGLGG
ncbi:MAG: hypothetical protein GY788_32915, partial [bacterium]|nr:hypothetical protein [bacterium]